ncbi:MAG: Rrf2 family transcriptional regulator [Pseudomonadota bacterium]
MRLTTKGRYAVALMLDIAIQGSQGPVHLGDVAERQKLSLSYLERLAHVLRQKTLLQSVRGPGGGYLLGKPAEQLTVAMIIAAVDESLDATHCSGKANCHQGVQCLTHNIWQSLTDQISGFLETITLKSLVERADIQVIAQRQRQMRRIQQLALVQHDAIPSCLVQEEA